MSIKARQQTKGHGNQSIHWTHQFAVEDRVKTPYTLEEVQPQCNPKDLPLSQLLPNNDIQESFRRECSVLIGRVLVKYYAPFNIFRDVIINHLPHPFLEDTSKKSHINCLGLEFFNSNIAGEMAQLMMKNQQHYVPLTDGESNQAEILEPIFFDGDALTEERARNAQWMFKDGDSRIDRLEGLDPVHTDWHTKVKLYELEYKTFFRSSSAQEIGTTCASMNRTGKTNAKKGPHDEYNAFRDFHDREIEAHILASFLTHIGATSLKELPSSFRDQFPAESESASARRQWLNAIIDEYMTQFVFDGTVNRDLVVVADEVDRLHSNEINGYRCRAPGCEMTYKSHAWRVRHELSEHEHLCVPDTPPHEEKDSEGYFRCSARCGLVFKTKASMNRHVQKQHPQFQPMDVDEPSDIPEDKSEDYLYNYHRGKLIFGLFMLDLNDAIREGDGQRLMNLYKIGLLFFNFHGCTKYFYTTLLLLVKLNAILPEGKAFRLIWNRFFNKHGWKGRNIPLDLRLEHLNNFLKACLKVLGANMKEKNAQRVALSLDTLECILDSIDNDCNWEVKARARSVKSPEETVFQIYEDLNHIKAFQQTPGRKGHPSFPNFTPSIPGKIDYGKLYQSMTEKINLWSNIYDC